MARRRSQAERRPASPALRRRRAGDLPRSGRFGGPTQYRDPGALPAGRGLLRHGQALPAPAGAFAARQGGALSGTQRFLDGGAVRGRAPHPELAVRSRLGGLPGRGPGSRRALAGGAVHPRGQGQRRRSGVGAAMGDRRRRSRHRELRQPHPDTPGGHPRDRVAQWSRPGPSGVLRVPRSPAQGTADRRRGHLGAVRVRAVGQARRTPVQRPDQGSGSPPVNPGYSFRGSPRTRSACG